jgi:hypothetical protein
MPRRYLAIPVVIALGVLLYVLFGRGDDEASKTDEPTATRINSGSPPAIVPPGDRSAVRQPRPPGDPDDVAAAAGNPPRTYVTDTGNPVRDHRDSVVDPVAVPAPLPPSQRTMSPTITGDIYRQLAPIVRKCGIDAPKDGRGADPVVHVTLIVDVAAGQLTATDASAVATDLPGPTAEQVVACVRERASALTVAANGEPDRTGYVVQYPIRLRK